MITAGHNRLFHSVSEKTDVRYALDLAEVVVAAAHDRSTVAGSLGELPV